MRFDLLQKAAEFNKKHRWTKGWHRVLMCLAVVVVFCTTYALILPAITMEKTATCGYEEHTHTDECYEVIPGAKTYTCNLSLHVHESGCYGADGSVVCGSADFAIHAHNADCYAEDGSLVCQLPEVYTHAHGSSCYNVTEASYQCGLEEGAGAHIHTTECYQTETLICGMEEGIAANSLVIEEAAETQAEEASDLNAETVDVPQETEVPQVISEHVHDASCYAVSETALCGLDASEGHVHTDECLGEETSTLTCGMQELYVHTHGESCYDASGNRVCGLLEAYEHVHTEECFTVGESTVNKESGPICGKEEHTHDEAICYLNTNTNADVETASDWEATLPAELSGNWRKDIIAVAQSQLGYTESSENVTVTADGRVLGYTRYGAWYGDHYGDWCAMFVSFCLNYAEVPRDTFPIESNCRRWINDLTPMGLYKSATEYTPKSGDVIFFEYDGDNSSDHVGLVYEVSNGQIVTIEGNNSNKVEYFTYDANANFIMGYGVIPSQRTQISMDGLTDEEQAKVKYVIQLIDDMPSADEIDAKLAEFEEADDYEGEEAWLTEIYQLVDDIYFEYSILRETLQPYVVNADKLLELEYIWSQTLLIDGIASDTPTVVPATGSDPVVSTSDFVKLNIYDYYGAASASAAGKTNINNRWTSNKNYPGFQWNGGAYMTSSTFSRSRVDNIDFGNSMITDFNYGSSSTGISNGLSTNYQKVGNQGGSINQVIGYTNQPIGYSSGSGYDAMSHKLVNGYPALSDGTSLSYLFSESNYASKKNSANIDGLFRQNQKTGEYWFDSRDNHAQYANNKFTLYNQIITPNFILYPFGNFLPFNSITNRSEATQVSKIDYVVQGANNNPGYMQTIINRLIQDDENSTEQQLIDMLAQYRDSLKGTGENYTWTVEQALIEYFSNSSEFKNDYNYTTLFSSSAMQNLLSKLYNIDFDVKKNFMFGMDMEMNFMQPKDGMTGNDTNNDGKPDYPMEFYFAGDDDVWVYIDGILFLDLTGIHRHVGGDIDFVNGKVNYYMMDSYIDGAVESTPYKTYTFAEILKDIGGISQSDLGIYLKQDANGNYTTFKDYTTHNFKFYYMERGTGSSVCRINFNFPMLRQNSISVSKEVESNGEILGNPDYKFQVLKANSDTDKTKELFIAGNTNFEVYDLNNNYIRTSTTDANGVFAIKAGERAVFEGIKENSGKYYVRELLNTEDFEQYGTISVDGATQTFSYEVTVGKDSFTGVDSPVKDMSEGSTLFHFNNKIDLYKLGNLSITKVLNSYPQVRAISKFDFEVTLDGKLISVGTEYVVKNTDGTTSTKKVETEGIITLEVGQTATISKIISGSKFEVKETSASSSGYTVTYTGDGITTDGSSATGVIQHSSTVAVNVTNSENGASVTIPGTKTVPKLDGQEHTFKFNLVQVTDQSGATLSENGTAQEATVVVKDSTIADFGFTLHYIEREIETIPTEYYYKIVEIVDSDKSEQYDYDESVYVVKVTVSKADGVLKADLTGVWKDGKAYEPLQTDFTNRLLKNLSISKTVTGIDVTDTMAFVFDLTIKDGEEPLTGTYKAGKSDGTYVDVIFDEEGKTSITLKPDETITIEALPYGATWSVTETNTDGYVVSTIVGTGGDAEIGATVAGQLTSGSDSIEFINESTYELPETGGSGTNLYTIGGILLIVIAGGLLWYKQKKRRKEDWASF